MWLEYISCDEDVTSFSDCQRSQWGNTHCDSACGVRVRCFNNTSSQLEMRLGGGTNEYCGRLEVKYAGEWGTVCNHFFDDKSAHVCCKEMGFTSGEYLTHAGVLNDFIQDIETIWLDSVLCNGTESSIMECNKSEWGIHNCEHWEDVVIRCFNGSLTTTGYELRLTGGPRASYGLLEIKYAGVWGVFCEGNFDHKVATVACRDLGYEWGGLSSTGVDYNSKTQLGWFSIINCHGNETLLGECIKGHLQENKCVSIPVYLWCTNNFKYELRLAGRSGTFPSLLEVMHNGTWGTICNNHFDDFAADLAFYLGI